VQIRVTGAFDFAEAQIVSANQIIASLEAHQVTSAGNQTALQAHLTKAVRDLQKGKLPQATDNLEKAIERTDGCVLSSEPDSHKGAAGSPTAWRRPMSTTCSIAL
jgi:Tfp pilus assembly protein PilF